MPPREEMIKDLIESYIANNCLPDGLTPEDTVAELNKWATNELYCEWERYAG